MQRLPIRIRHMEVVAPVHLRQASPNLQLEVMRSEMPRPEGLQLEVIPRKPQLEVMNRKTPHSQKLPTFLPTSRISKDP